MLLHLLTAGHTARRGRDNGKGVLKAVKGMKCKSSNKALHRTRQDIGLLSPRFLVFGLLSVGYLDGQAAPVNSSFASIEIK